MPEPIDSGDEKAVWSKTKTEYGPLYEEHIIKIFELYERSAQEISARRQLANSYYLTICTSILGFTSLFPSDTFTISLVLVGGIFICVGWRQAINSYKDINRAKFQLLHEIESKLPIKVYTAEWDLLDEGKNPKVYSPFSKVEMYIPIIFALLMIGGIVRNIGSDSIVDLLSSLCS